MLTITSFVHMTEAWSVCTCTTHLHIHRHINQRRHPGYDVDPKLPRLLGDRHHNHKMDQAKSLKLPATVHCAL